MTNQQTTTVKGRFNKLDANRKQHLDRQRDCASLTIPSLLPPEGKTENDPLPTPWQGLGARGLNNLAAKLLLIMFPPNSPFFRLMPSTKIEDEIEQGQDKDAKTKLEEALGKLERRIMRFIESSGYRVPVFKALKLLIATGNALLFLPNEGGCRVYRLDQFTIVRDPMGNVLEIITRELISPLALPEDVREEVEGRREQGADPDADIELFTQCKRTADNWAFKQEARGVTIAGTEGTYPLDDCPFIAPPWSSNVGENYSRGLVEEYLGDFNQLETLTQAISEGSAAAAKILFLVNPAGIAQEDDLARTPNGGFAAGRQDDVTCLQLNKHADFRVAAETMGQIAERLSHAFLLNSSVQRQAERVTAEEIRFMASELEDALGGVYSTLSQELQRPLLKRIMAQMKHAKQLPKMPSGFVEPTIVTGLEALGRGHDLTKLQMFIQNLDPLGPALPDYLNIANYILRVAASLGIETTGLVITEEERQAKQQQAMMQQMMAQAGPDLVGTAAKGMVDAGGGEQLRAAVSSQMGAGQSQTPVEQGV